MKRKSTLCKTLYIKTSFANEVKGFENCMKSTNLLQ